MALFTDMLGALDRARARYVVVGGVAVVLHGHLRLTADLDLVVDLAPDNARAAVEALEAIGLVPRLPVAAADFADPDVRRRWVRDRALTVFTLVDPGDPLRSVDLFATEPRPFEELWQSAVHVTIDGADVPVASIEHLLEMKRAAGRPSDWPTSPPWSGCEMTVAEPAPGERWDWEAAERAQRRRWLEASAQARLEWLEQAIEFAAAAGALDPGRR